MGGLQNRDTAAKLKAAPSQLMKELRGQYRKAAREAAAKAQARILAAESHHPGDLREHIAGTVTVSVRARGRDALVAEIASRGTLMPPGQHNLNAYADAETPRYTRWRHPVFRTAKRDVWVTQVWPSARGWFTTTLQREKDNFAAAAQKAMDDIAARLR